MISDRRQLPEFEPNSTLGHHYKVLFRLTSTEHHPYPVEYASYVVKDERNSSCRTIQALDKAASASCDVDVPVFIEEALSGKHASPFVLSSSESFIQDGYLCNVHDLHGPDLMVVNEPAQRSATWTRKIFREILESLDFLHSNGVVHGDVMEWSAIITYPCLESLEDDEIKEFYRPKNGGVFSWNSLGSGPRGHELNLNFRVKLQNLRRAFLFGNPPLDIEQYTNTNCPPPELVANAQVSAKTDIWYLGIMLANFIYCNPEDATFGGERSYDRQQQFADCQEFLGPLPEKYVSVLSTDYQGRNTTKRDLYEDILEARQFAFKSETVTNMKDENEKDLFCPKSLELATDLIKGLLHWDPEHRLTAKQALGHEFFQGTYQIDGKQLPPRSYVRRYEQ